MSDVTPPPPGLTMQQAARRRATFGPNSVAEATVHPLRRLAGHFWSPVPWMLETVIVLQLAIGERLEAGLIATLLVLNAILGFVQESRANATLALLKQRLALTVKLRRDGAWIDAASPDLVPGDIVQLSLGGIVPADIRILTGQVALDQSMLTGESASVEAGPGATGYAGALIRRGEAVAEVTATGARTYFGRTADLVRTASVESSEQKAVMNVVRALTVVNFVIVVGMVAYALAIGLTLERIMPLVLTAMLSAVPVALPATFTLAAAVGARILARRGILLTRLSALHEAAMIDVLCADKTGTLTENAPAISAVVAARGWTQADVLRHAAAASSADGQDPIDRMIRAAATGHPMAVTQFVPFDPGRKIAEAWTRDADRNALRIVKGAPAAVAVHAGQDADITAAQQRLMAQGNRTLAIAAGQPDALRVIGLIAFRDPPRADSAPLLAELGSLGVRLVMVTGDAPVTAVSVARAIGLDPRVGPPGGIPPDVTPEAYGVFAGVFPEDKYRLVKAFQQHGHIVGMCGDGANDAPALRQAQTGIAVSSATDIAKSAAGVVLTEPGLGGIVTCVKEGRSAFQRVLTYTLSLLVNKCVTLFVLAAGLVVTGHAVLTPLLQAIWMVTSDLVTMARAADHAEPTPYPNAWRVGALTLAGVPLALVKLAFCLAVLACGWYWLHLAPAPLRTLIFLTLVYSGQVIIYVLREQRRVWFGRPAPVMIAATVANLAIVTAMAWFGLAMAPLPPAVIATLLAANLGFAWVLDEVKLLVRARLPIDRAPLTPRCPPAPSPPPSPRS